MDGKDLEFQDGRLELGDVCLGFTAKELQLVNEFLDKTSLTIRRNDDEIFGIGQKGPEPYFPHGFQGRVLNALPKPLERRPNILKKLLRDGKITASHTLQKELCVHREMAGNVVNNTLYGLIAANSYEAPLLTHNPLHISCLNELSGDANKTIIPL